jgi:hypothetical protein
MGQILEKVEDYVSSSSISLETLLDKLSERVPTHSPAAATGSPAWTEPGPT